MGPAILSIIRYRYHNDAAHKGISFPRMLGRFFHDDKQSIIELCSYVVNTGFLPRDLGIGKVVQ
jgi:hypothetical protein